MVLQVEDVIQRLTPFHIESDSRFFVEETIGGESRNQINDEIVYGAMTGVFYFANISPFPYPEPGLIESRNYN